MVRTVYPIKVTIPEAELLADLYGIANDLETANERCQRALGLATSDPRDIRLVEALVESALIRYFRCFKRSKARVVLSKTDLNPPWLDLHNDFESLRDKFVAHSENPFEATCITAGASKEDGIPFPINTIGYSDTRVMLNDDHARDLARLTSHVQSVVRVKFDNEKPQVLKAIQSMPLEELYSGDMPLPLDISAGDVHRNRKRV